MTADPVTPSSEQERRGIHKWGRYMPVAEHEATLHRLAEEIEERAARMTAATNHAMAGTFREAASLIRSALPERAEREWAQ